MVSKAEGETCVKELALENKRERNARIKQTAWDKL